MGCQSEGLKRVGEKGIIEWLLAVLHLHLHLHLHWVSTEIDEQGGGALRCTAKVKRPLFELIPVGGGREPTDSVRAGILGS